MSIRIQDSQQVSPASSGDSGQDPGKGSFKGRDVTQKVETDSLLAGDSGQPEVETEEKSLQERMENSEEKERQGTLKRAAFSLKDDELYKRLHLLNFLAALKQRNATTHSQVLTVARQFFQDVSNQYLALTFSRSQLVEEGGKSELIQAIDSVLAEMELKHGARIQAGLNVLQRAVAFENHGVGKADELQKFYGDTLESYEGATQTYEAILEKYGSEGVPDAIEFLMQALGDDLASKGSSLTKVELKKIIDELDNLKFLNTLHEKCTRFMDRLENVYGAIPGISTLELMKKVLVLKDEKWITDSSIDTFVSKTGVDDLGTRIQFLRELSGLGRAIPLKMFELEENRGNFLRAIQDSLDLAIAQEEEEMED